MPRKECSTCETEWPEHLLDGGLCPDCRRQQDVERQRVERSLRTTWVEDPADPDGYGDRR